MGATQKLIAERLGISRSLVSRALNGSAAEIRANPATVARIRTEANRLAYRPSAAALALRGGATRTIGVLVKDFADPFFGRMLAELDRGTSSILEGATTEDGTAPTSVLDALNSLQPEAPVSDLPVPATNAAPAAETPAPEASGDLPVPEAPVDAPAAPATN